jgi:hypothetical protein
MDSFIELYKILSSIDWIELVRIASSIFLAFVSWLSFRWQEKYKLGLRLVESKLNAINELNNKNIKDKVELYWLIIPEIAKVMNDLELINLEQNEKEKRARIDQTLDRFYFVRMVILGKLGLCAPEVVFNTTRELLDQIHDALDDFRGYSFQDINEKAELLLNLVRQDVGLESDYIYFNSSILCKV